MDILKEVFARGIAVSPYVRLTSEKDEMMKNTLNWTPYAVPP